MSDLQRSPGAILGDQHWVDGVHAGAIEPDQVVVLQVLDGLQLNQHEPVEADLVEVDPLYRNSGAPLKRNSVINQPIMSHYINECLLVYSGGDIFILVTQGLPGGHAVHDTRPAALQNAVKIF